MNNYGLTANNFAFGRNIYLLNDLSESPTPLDIESLVASGDVFAVLATELDEVNLTLTRSPSVDVSPKLDKLTEILLYLQQHYNVSRKTD